MNRRSFFGGASALGVGAIVTYALQPTQDDIDNLEATVEDLDSRVSALETQAAGEPSSAKSSDDADSSDDAPQSEGEWQTVEGVGQTVSEKFHLDSGTYRVHASADVASFDGFSVFIYPPAGGQDLLFNEIIGTPGEWAGETVYKAGESGEYYVEVSNTSSAWTLQFEPY
jgi:hypothetical protein